MKLETFFEKFDQFADAPDAVAKMRELVLELAVQGKLVEQRPNELSARECIRKANKPLVNVALDESIQTPAGWVALPLGCIIACNRGGGTPSKANPDYWNGSIPWASVKDIRNEKFLVSTIDSITEEGLKNSSSNLIPPGRLLVVTRMGLGKLAINNVSVAINQDLRAIEPTMALDLNFAYLLFKSLKMVGSGVTVKGITVDKLHAMPVGLPPLAEQKRIVAKVDELMALCDRLEAQQQERDTRRAALARAALARFADAPTPANLNFLFHKSYDISPADLRKSILTLAVQGKLVPQDPNDGDSRDMIDIAMEKRRKTIKTKSLRRKELDESADLFEHKDLPSSWCVERFANIVDPENTISYGVLVPGNDVPDGIPFVRAQDLCLSNHPARPNKTIAPEIEKPYARTRLTGGEILLCVVGSIGKLGVVPESWAGANIARAVARIKPIPDVLRDYLLLVLQEQSVQNYFTSTTRTLAQPTLNVGMIEQTPIPIPPLAEQRRIVAKVDQLMALVDELETHLAASRATAKNLLEALVAELTAAGTPPRRGDA